MNIVELIETLGISAERKKINEYSSPCPFCKKGEDRFVIWNEQGRFFCRICNEKGDIYDICMKVLNMSYKEAVEYVGKKPDTPNIKIQCKTKTINASKSKINKPIPASPLWQSKAKALIDSCHKALLSNKEKIKELKKTRGLTLDSIKRFNIGWHNEERFESLNAWGVVKNENEKTTKIYIPRGYLIPYCLDSKVVRLRFRQIDKMPKYINIKNSNVIIPYKINHKDIVVVVETDFDAMLIAQELKDTVTAMALGSCSYYPDDKTHEFLEHAALILCSLDSDEKGLKYIPWWLNEFDNAYHWPTPTEKDPGEAYLKGLSINEWITTGIEHYKKNFWNSS
jgi:DNA primase